MLLRKDTISTDDIKKYFDADKSCEDGYTYYINVTAYCTFPRKTYSHVAIQVIGERTQEDYTMRDTCMDIPMGKAYLSKPMRKTARELIYKEAKEKLLEKALRIIKDENHPYLKTLNAM